MTTIQTRCPACDAHITLVPASIGLTLRTGDDLDGEYDYTCPACLEHVTRPAGEECIGLLRQAGIAPAVGEAPAHPERPMPGPAFTPDDLIDFHLLLASVDWFHRLRSGDAADRV
jgi:hypothetical protein